MLFQLWMKCASANSLWDPEKRKKMLSDEFSLKFSKKQAPWEVRLLAGRRMDTHTPRHTHIHTSQLVCLPPAETDRSGATALSCERSSILSSTSASFTVDMKTLKRWEAKRQNADKSLSTARINKEKEGRKEPSSPRKAVEPGERGSYAISRRAVPSPPVLCVGAAAWCLSLDSGPTASPPGDLISSSSLSDSCCFSY